MEVLKVKVDFKMPSNGSRHESLKIKVKYATNEPTTSNNKSDRP
jgi:hypothetical protein